MYYIYIKMKKTFDQEFSRLFEINLQNKFKKDFELYYKQNKVNQCTIKNIIISTVYANDIKKYETAIKNKDKNDDWYIVEYYLNLEDAELGSEKWIANIKNKTIKQVLNLDDNIMYDLK